MNLSYAPEIDCREMSGIHHFVDMSLANQEKGGPLFVEEIETGFASLDRQSLTHLQFNELVSLKYELGHWRILTKNRLVWRPWGDDMSATERIGVIRQLVRLKLN